MRKFNRLTALVLALIMVISCAPISIFAADTGLSYESELYSSSDVSAYKHYEATWNDPTYVKGGVKYTVFYDAENATDAFDVIYYVINWNDKGIGRIGTDSDVDIVKDIVEGEASVLTGNRAAVVVVDFGGNELAKPPYITDSIATLAKTVTTGKKLTVWGEGSSTTTVAVDDLYSYTLPAGYRIARDIEFFELDYHASLGTGNAMMGAWNSWMARTSDTDTKYETIYYAYHTGDSACTFDHAANADVECIAGAPQEIDGVVVPYPAGQPAPKVSRVEDCRREDGSPLDYTLRLDVAYPSGDAASTGLYVKVNSSGSRSMTPTITTKNYTSQGGGKFDYGRGDLVDMMFSGCSAAIFDHEYYPIARSDHYGHHENYGSYYHNSAKVGRAAIRCLRYFADTFGYDEARIGIAGISKASPAAGVLSTVNNAQVGEYESYTYTVNGTKVATRGLWYEGDLNADGSVTDNGIVQPYLTYEDGYNGKNVASGSQDYTGSKSGEISSDVLVAYCSAGMGVKRMCLEDDYGSSDTILLGVVNPATGVEVQHVPMALSAGYYDEYDAWGYWDDLLERFGEYADNPYLAIPMEDRGHEIPNGVDPIRDYVRDMAYAQFFLSYLRPEGFSNSVAYMTPVNGADKVSLTESIDVQLIKPAASLDAFKSAASVTDVYGKAVEGTWTTNAANTSGLYTFEPASFYEGGLTYTVTVDSSVVGTKTQKNFTTEAAGTVRPVADTYISSVAGERATVFGSAEQLLVDNSHTYFVTFKTSDLGDANKAYLKLPVSGTSSQTVYVYLVDDYTVNESTLCYNNAPALDETMLVSEQVVSEEDCIVDLLGLAASVKGEYFTLAVKGSAHYYKLDFEEYSAGTALRVFNTGTNPPPSDAPVTDSGFSEHYVWRTGGGSGTMKAAKNPDGSNDMVATITSNETWNRIRWYNSFVTNKNWLDEDDLGKEFDVSFDLRIKAPADGGTLKLSYALDAVSGTLTTYNPQPEADTWTTYTKTFTITKDLIYTDGELNKKSVLSFSLSGAKKSVYYFDDIAVIERAPTALASRESTSAISSSIITEVIDESGIIADTFVSSLAPSVAHGDLEYIKVSDGVEENIAFVTFSAKAVNKGDTLIFNIPASNDTGIKAELLLLDGYYVNEKGLTYNNMPDLDGAVSLGEYTLSGGANSVIIPNSSVEGDYFTLVIKSKVSVSYGYENGFEIYSANASLGSTANKVNVEGQEGVQIYYSIPSASLSLNSSCAYTGGNLGARTVIADPDGSGNKILKVLSSSSTVSVGRLKIYNSIGDSLEKIDEMVGKTYRFTAKVRSEEGNGAIGKDIYVAALPTSGSPSVGHSIGEKLKFSTEWQTVSVEYTVNANHINVLNEKGTYYDYPTFSIEFPAPASKTPQNIYYVDDLKVVELYGDGEATLELCSKEGESEGVGFESRANNMAIADTYVSAAYPTESFGKEDKLVVNGGAAENILFATFSSALVNENEKLSLSLPATASQDVKVEIFVLDGYMVDESALTYATMPALDTALSLGKYDIKSGSNEISLDGLELEGEYFTIAMVAEGERGWNYFDDFEDKAVGTLSNTPAANREVDPVTGITHAYNFSLSTAAPKESVMNKGGDMSTYAIKVDGDNQVFYAKSHSSKAGRIRFYNALNDSHITKESPIVGKTFRITAKVKGVNDAAIGRKVGFSIMPAIGTVYLKDTNGNDIVGTTVSLTNEWQTISIEYTVLADHIMFEYTSSGVTYYNYPMVSLEIYKPSGTAYEVYLDDLSVVELTSGSRLEFVSAEGAESASETLSINPVKVREIVADTYISSVDKNGVFGLEEKAYVDNKNTYLVSFKTADFVEGNKTFLSLPLAGSGSQNVSLYLLDSFKVDEATTCYNNTPALDQSKLIRSYTVVEGTLSVLLEPIAAQASGEYFTIAVAGSAHYYELNFNEYTSDKSVAEYDNNVVDSVETDKSHMYSFTTASMNPLRTRRGGSLGTRKITSVSNNMLFSITTDTGVTYGGYIKFYNALNDSIDDDIVGKTFKYSADVKLSGDNSVAEAAKTKPSVKVGIIRTGSNDFLGYKTASYDMLKENSNGWVTLEGEYTIPAAEVGKEMTSQYTPKLRFSYPAFGMFFEHVGAKNSGSYTYYVDNIKVAEVAPTELVTINGEGENRVSVYAGGDVIADTYVSKAHPDTSYGSEETIKFGDKDGDKKAAVLSFLNSSIDGKNYVDLNLFNSGDAIKNVYVYYVLDYLANENSLTWNTMPEYENNLLGVYDFGVGDNKIDLTAIKDKLEGDFFTLVLRTESHTFYEDFESYPVGTALVNGTSHDNNVVDAETGLTHAHAFAEQVYYPEENTIIIRRNGVLSYHKVETDAENSANQLLRVMTGTAQNYDGAIKFYNALNDEAITKDSDIVGKTFRFSAEIKLDEAHTNQAKLDKVSVTAGALTSNNNKYRGNTSVVKYDQIKDGWATLSVDYTVSADHIREEGVSDNIYTYPILSLYFGDDITTSGNHGYFVDNVSVVEVVDGVAIGDAEFGSREADGDIFFTSALNGNITILEATASGATDGDVISIVDGENTYSLLKAGAGKLMFGDIALCDQIGNDYVLGKDAVKVVAIYDDVNGTVRFAVGDYLAYYRDGASIKVTFELPAIEGGIGDNAALGNDGISASKLRNTTSEIIGFQTNYVERAVRFISGVDAIYYNAIGFKLETADNEKTVDSASVYSAVTADGKYVYAKDYGYNIMSAIALKEVKNGAVVKVTPFLRVGDNYIYGESVFYKIMVGTEITVVETDESEFGADSNANLASVKIDGEALAGLREGVTEYNVPAADPQSFVVEALAEESDANVVISAQEGNTVTVTVTSYNGVNVKTYKFTAYNKVESQVVNKNGADGMVTYVFDDGDTASATIVTKLSEKYPSITGSFALITSRLATLSTVEGEEGDGLLEYEFDEEGNYVYTKINDKWDYWQTLLADYPAFEAVNHTHTHAYIGEDDNGGSYVYKSTAGNAYTSSVFPKGNVTKEYYASNQILRELGQRALTMVGAGLTAPDGNMINYTESYKNLPQTSGAFIGKRTTYTYPKTPEVMVNKISDFTDEYNRFNVKAYMVQHYNASSTAPASTSAADYSREACLEAGVGYWTAYIDKAVEMGEWAAFCFHNVKADTHTGTTGHFVFESQLDEVFKHCDDLAKENKLWVASFTDACLYAFSRATSTVSSYVDGDNVIVTLSDKEDDSIFTMPLTVKVALPEGKNEASVDGNTLSTFVENGKTFAYVDVTPETSVTIAVK